jgi:hypothetical protein
VLSVERQLGCVAALPSRLYTDNQLCTKTLSLFVHWYNIVNKMKPLAELINRSRSNSAVQIEC